MKVLIIIFFCLFLFCSNADSSQTIGINVPCPALNEDGYVKFTFASGTAPGNGVVGTGMTNMETRQGVLWNHNHEMLFKARCDNPLQELSSHLSFFTDFNGTITYNAEWVTSTELNFSELYLKMYMFAFGVILALAFIGGMKSHV